ncbi:MAG: hypothetical protein GX146_12890 [Myxococcales bacterium]|nr:hypothetical protein [Myxococcales bacterium]
MTFSAISASFYYTCGIRTEDGIVVCWGEQSGNLWQ